MNAIITGATKGIGRAIALKLAKNGYNLAICARKKADLESLKLELEVYGNQVFTLVVDCGRKEEVLAFAEKSKIAFTKIDVLVNNVGVFMPVSLLDEEDEIFEQHLNVNLSATYYLSKFFGKVMRLQQSGHIFNICSIASTQAIENAGSYSVTKAAMLSLNHVLRKELAPYNVKVTAILPGATRTESWKGTTIPSEKFVQSDDIADLLYAALNLSSAANVDELIVKPIIF